MNCRTAVELMPEWAVERLDPADRDALDEHLRTCLSCSEEARSYSSMLTTLDAVELPAAGMRERLLVMISREARVSRRRKIVRSLAATAALVALAFLAVVYESRRTDGPPAATMATDRLRVVAAARETSGGADELMHVLQTDPNPAIRLAALDSLIQRTPTGELRPALERARRDERSPLVRRALTIVIEETD